MAWGGKAAQALTENMLMTREIELLRERIDELKADNADLKNRLKYTQEALIAKESPEVYADKRYDEAKALAEASTDDEYVAQRRKLTQEAKIITQLAKEMEKPLFVDAADMMEKLNRVTGLPILTNESLHNNDES